MSEGVRVIPHLLTVFELQNGNGPRNVQLSMTMVFGFSILSLESLKSVDFHLLSLVPLPPSITKTQKGCVNYCV